MRAIGSALRRPAPLSGRPALRRAARRLLSQERGAPASATLLEERKATLDNYMSQVHGRLAAKRTQEREQELAKLLEAPDLWDDAQRANKISREHGALAGVLERRDKLDEARQQAAELAGMALEDGDQDVLEECCQELAKLEAEAKRFHLETMLDGPTDSWGCFVEISAGSGGDEACDWAQMLLHMYERWATQNDFQAQVTETSPGEVAGIRSGILRLRGHNAYGWAKSESGVHRLVRISPFDQAGRRHTSFAMVAVMPMPEDEGAGDLDVELNDNEIRIDTYRSSGAGGQHVNTTDSAVRVTHLPTGLVAQCQAGRSQHQNKANALEVLRARLVQRKLEEQRAEREAIASGLGDNTFGNQIRSYVLHPYKMVKDHRTSYETSQAMAVLSGDPDHLTPFMEAALLDPKLQI